MQFSTGGFILVSDYVRMEVTLVGASWVVVAGDQAGVDFIPMKFFQRGDLFLLAILCVSCLSKPISNVKLQISNVKLQTQISNANL